MEKGYSIVLKFLEQYFGKRGARVVVCLILITFGIPHVEIQKKQGAALSTLRRYRKALEGGKIESLFVVADRKREQSELDSFEDKILDDFQVSPPATLREAQTRIEQITGLKRSLNRLNIWLKKRGFVRGQ